MVVLEVHTKSIKIKCKSTLLSKATLVFFMSFIISLIIPYLVAYHSGGLWLKWDVLYEQPKVEARGEYLIIAMTKSDPIVCSTFAFYRKHVNNLDFCYMIKLREIDNNLDGKVDKLSFNAMMSRTYEEISSIHIILPINYTLNTNCPLRMQSAITFQYYFYEKDFSYLHVMADLGLYQSSAIYCHMDYLHNNYDFPVIGSEGESRDFQFENILDKYLERNLTTILKNVYTNIKRENTNTFNLTLTVKYPEHKIYFHPGFWQVIKMAWIQYLAVLVVILWIVRTIKNYIFNKRLVLFYEDSPLKKNK